VKPGWRRRAASRVFEWGCLASVLLALAPLALILFYIVSQGAGSLNLEFLTQMPKPVGELHGGMLNAFAGTLILIGLAAALAIPVGVLGGLFLSEFRSSRTAFAVRFAADVLNGVPSIVVGMFAYAVVVLPFRRFSALAGGFALAVMIIPILTRSSEEILRLVPDAFREGALALGASRARASFGVVLPAALPGILTGILVGLARVAGETAPLLFTAFNNRFWSADLMKPIASLTVQIYTYAISPYEDWHRQAWAGALLLVLAITAISISARLVVARLERLRG
jgi:phosphate transport system permease protein